MTSVPDLTRMLAAIHEWQQGHGKPGGRADAARRLDEAQRLLDEIADVLNRHATQVAGQRSAAVITTAAARPSTSPRSL